LLFGQYKYIIQYQVKYGIDKKFSVEKDVKTFSADYILTPKEVKIQAKTQKERENRYQSTTYGQQFQEKKFKVYAFFHSQPSCHCLNLSISPRCTFWLD